MGDDQIQKRGADRAGSQDILEQARWLYGIHAERGNAAQHRGTAVMAFSGGVLALAPNALASSPSPLQWVAFAATVLLAVLTAGLSMGALVPRKSEGPSVADLCNLWVKHQRREGPADRVHQITETLLRTTEPEEPSFLTLTRRDADRRIVWLRTAYWSLGSALVAVCLLTTLSALEL